MDTDFNKIKAYYADFDEWERLSTPEGRLEFERSLQLLERHLEPDSRILDLGGGAGRYTIALASSGHRVVLADLSPELLEEARVRVRASRFSEQVESIDEVNAIDLERYADESFDAVVAFGPFYHLLDDVQRETAAGEGVRVTRPGGLVFAQFLPRVSAVAALIDRAAANPDQVTPNRMKKAWQAGLFRNATDSGFQEGYYAPPGAIETLFDNVGLSAVETVSLRSLIYGHERRLTTLSDPLRQAALALATEAEADPDVVAACGHAVYVGRKN